MHKDFKDTTALIKAAAKFDKCSTDKIQQANWYQTNYLPLAQAMYKRAFTTIGNEICKFDGNIQLYFSQRLAAGLALFPSIELKHNKGAISRQICVDLKGLTTSDHDPYTFMKDLKFDLCNTGSSKNSQSSGTSYNNNNYNTNKPKNYRNSGRGRGRGRRIQYKRYSAKRNARYPPQKCDYCAKRRCDNEEHRDYWEKEFLKGVMP